MVWDVDSVQQFTVVNGQITRFREKTDADSIAAAYKEFLGRYILRAVITEIETRGKSQTRWRLESAYRRSAPSFES